MTRGTIHRGCAMAFAIVLALSATGCSVFISTPRVARFHVQQLDDKFIEYVVNLDDPAETNIDIHLNKRYTLQLDFDWLWNMNDRSDIYIETQPESADDPRLDPWMLCKYRF